MARPAAPPKTCTCGRRMLLLHGAYVCPHCDGNAAEDATPQPGGP